MREIDAVEAKNQLGALLDLVVRGEEITVTRHGKPVARLVAFRGGPDRAAVRAAVARILALRQGVTLDAPIRDLIDDDRL